MSVRDRPCLYCGVLISPGRVHDCAVPRSSWSRHAEDAVLDKPHAVRDLVIAVDRLVDGWAEADSAGRSDLWRAMTEANVRVAELHRVYPLAAERVPTPTEAPQ